MVAEVLQGSFVDSFLNGFVDAHNSAGHAGVFFDPDLESASLRGAGFILEPMQRIRYAWRFAGEIEMLDFAIDLFGLDLATRASAAAGIEKYLCPQRTADGLQFDWELGFFAGSTEPLR